MIDHPSLGTIIPPQASSVSALNNGKEEKKATPAQTHEEDPQQYVYDAEGNL